MPTNPLLAHPKQPMARFDIAYNLTARVEGGYANNPSDKGGETYAGVARNFWPKWGGWAVIDAVKARSGLKNIDAVLAKDTALHAEIARFYKQNYWDVNSLDGVANQAIANELYDTAVNMGVGVAARFAQRALNVTNQNQALYPDVAIDGSVGPTTLRRLNEHPYPALVLKVLNVLQGYRYIEIAEKAPAQEQFMRSWMSRVAV